MTNPAGNRGKGVEASMKMVRKLKGFTLVELIIVLALFSLIMFSVVQLLSPVTKYFVRSSNFEQTTACIDNMKRAIEGNLKYADRVRAYAGYIPYTITTNMSGDEVITPTSVLDDHVQAFYDEFFTNRSFIDCTGDIYVLVFDNSVDEDSLKFDTLKEFTDAEANSGRIVRLVYHFDNPAAESAPGTPALDLNPDVDNWYVNQKMYGNFNYQFILGAPDSASWFSEAALDSGSAFVDELNSSISVDESASVQPVLFEPRNCCVQIRSYEVAKNYEYEDASSVEKGHDKLIMKPEFQTFTASFTMRNVLDPSTNYRTALDDFPILHTSGASGYDVSESVHTYSQGLAVPRYRPVTNNSTTDFSENIENKLNGTTGTEAPGFYFIFTLAETTRDNPDSAYLADVESAFASSH